MHARTIGEMKILVIPTTDWIRHPVPNRLNFIFDTLAEEHDVYVLHFGLKRFSNLEARETKCRLVEASWIKVDDPSLYYLLNFPYHLWKIRSIVKKLDIDVILSTNILPSFAANFAGTHQSYSTIWIIWRNRHRFTIPDRPWERSSSRW